jgi:3-oxoacyl-[acyl-carrier protein] reductase
MHARSRWEEAGINAVYRIGDCARPSFIADAIFSGPRLAREIDSDNPAQPLPFIRDRRVVGAPSEEYVVAGPLSQSVYRTISGREKQMSRTVIVTGAGSGIGVGIVKSFIDAGDRVFLVDLSKERVEKTAASFGTSLASAHVADVRDAAALEALAREVIDETGRIDVLVSNAGVFDGIATVETTSHELWDKIIGINLTGPFNFVKAFVPKMIEQKSGRVIMVGSIAGQRALPDGLAYTTSKAGLEGFTRRLAFDVGPYGVTANLVAPGAIRSNIRANSEEILGDLVPDVNVGVGSDRNLMKMLVPLGHYGEPADIAETILFLASEGARYITGEMIHVDGGWIAS